MTDPNQSNSFGTGTATLLLGIILWNGNGILDSKVQQLLKQDQKAADWCDISETELLPVLAGFLHRLLHLTLQRQDLQFCKQK